MVEIAFRMVAIISKFTKVLETCKKKFNLFFKRYKIEFSKWHFRGIKA